MIDKLILTTLLTISLLYGCAKEVAIESQKWTYEKGVCTVSFKLRNNGNENISQNVRIVAHKKKSIGDALVSDIIGEKVINIKLEPYEEKQISETLYLLPNKRPDIVAVSNYGAK